MRGRRGCSSLFAAASCLLPRPKLHRRGFEPRRDLVAPRASAAAGMLGGLRGLLIAAEFAEV